MALNNLKKKKKKKKKKRLLIAGLVEGPNAKNAWLVVKYFPVWLICPNSVIEFYGHYPLSSFLSSFSSHHAEPWVFFPIPGPATAISWGPHEGIFYYTTFSNKTARGVLRAI